MHISRESQEASRSLVEAHGQPKTMCDGSDWLLQNDLLTNQDKRNTQASATDQRISSSGIRDSGAEGRGRTCRQRSRNGVSGSDRR